MTTKRLDDIDKLKGLAIFLVVLGHIVAREPPEGAGWYVVLKKTIYLFHMPLFMFVSGLILAYARKPITTMADYGKYLKKKFMRLMPAYFLFAAIVFFGKLVFSQLMQVDNPVGSISSFFDVIIDPGRSYCAYLWYIYVLFVFYAIAPLAYWITRDRIEWLLPLTLVLHFWDAPSTFAIASVAEYSFVFLLGAIAGEHYEKYDRVVTKWGPAFAFSFIIMASFSLQLGVSKFALGLLSIPSCHAIVTMRWSDWGNILKLFAAYTFPIYLMNTMCIGVAKGMLLKFSSWDGANFYWFAVVLLIAGLVGPILAKRWVINRVPVLNQIIL